MNERRALEDKLTDLEEQIRHVHVRMRASTPGQPKADACRMLANLYRRVANVYVGLANVQETGNARGVRAEREAGVGTR